MPVKLPETPTTSAVGPEQNKGANPASMIDRIPVKLVLMLAAPYLAGETPEQAIELAHKLYEKEKYASTLDILGEDMESAADCDASVEAYKNLVDIIISHPLPVQTAQEQITISFKPSMFSTKPPKGNGFSDPELDRCFERIKEVTDYAKRLGVNVTLEAEDHRWTDFHLDTYFSLVKQGYSNLGTVIQTRLFRTADDINRFEEGMRTRLVIGIYNEPSQVAHTSKPIMKDLLVSFAKTLLAKGTYIELATHDTDCLNKFFGQLIVPGKISRTRFETQYLHGVPRDELQAGLISGNYFSKSNFPKATADELEELATTGVVVRKYLPFGEGRVAGAYCRRRLKENPNMIGYGIKNFLKLQ
ncbi:MAG: proline dehydrogenase family protein [Candidatus Obscuribacterales bacterium]|nr:proline dehydrogenase family protein [Candidatus Obscuribacterales bacterium]